MSGILGVIAFLAIAWLFVLAFVYGDAKENSTQSAFLWALVSFFGGIAGLLIYVLLGRDDAAADG